MSTKKLTGEHIILKSSSVISWLKQARRDKSEDNGDNVLKLMFLTYELFGLTILRFTQSSTDRRDCCVGNLGAITFTFWVQIRSRCSKILLGKGLDTLSSSQVKTSKGYHKKRGLAIRTEKTVLILKDGCNVSAIVQYTSQAQAAN